MSKKLSIQYKYARKQSCTAARLTKTRKSIKTHKTTRKQEKNKKNTRQNVQNDIKLTKNNE